MFALSDMQALLNARPFVPFRLWLSDGGHVDVLSREFVLPDIVKLISKKRPA